MRQEREPEDLIEVWTLLEEDQERLRNKSGANRLGFALLLKFFEVEARFPENSGGIPVPAVSYVAQQVKVAAEEYPSDLRAAAGPVRYTLLSTLCHVNTLLLQDILSEQKWHKRLTDADRRALSPLFWTHVNPYGRFELDTKSHLDLAAATAAVPGPRTVPEAETARSAADGADGAAGSAS